VDVRAGLSFIACAPSRGLAVRVALVGPDCPFSCLPHRPVGEVLWVQMGSTKRANSALAFVHVRHVGGQEGECTRCYAPATILLCRIPHNAALLTELSKRTCRRLAERSSVMGHVEHPLVRHLVRLVGWPARASDASCRSAVWTASSNSSISNGLGTSGTANSASVSPHSSTARPGSPVMNT